MANAQFNFYFTIHLPSKTGGSGDTFRKTINLTTYSYANNNYKTFTRAKEIATDRLCKWLAKVYGYPEDNYVITFDGHDCIG